MTSHASLKRFLAALLAFASWGACAENFLWRVDSLTNHVYLFGTIHAGKASWYPMPKAVDEASRRMIQEFAQRNAYHPRAGLW